MIIELIGGFSVKKAQILLKDAPILEASSVFSIVCLQITHDSFNT